MYHPTCKKACPQECSKEWLYWSGSAWTLDTDFNVLCGNVYFNLILDLHN